MAQPQVCTPIAAIHPHLQMLTALRTAISLAEAWTAIYTMHPAAAYPWVLRMLPSAEHVHLLHHGRNVLSKGPEHYRKVPLLRERACFGPLARPGILTSRGMPQRHAESAAMSTYLVLEVYEQVEKGGQYVDVPVLEQRPAVVVALWQQQSAAQPLKYAPVQHAPQSNRISSKPGPSHVRNTLKP